MIKIRKFLTVILLVKLVSLEEISNSTHFIATNEWQQIKEGQIVPQGLHYRINLETGYKEAKILQEDNEKTSLVATENEDDETGEKQNTDVFEGARMRLEEALKNIPADKFDEETEEEWKEISKKFRSYKEIKEELKDIELNLKSEMEIMNSLVAQINSENLEPEDKLSILGDLEYFSHNIDNSLHFISIGGLEKIILPNLNNSNSKIIIKSINLLGVVVQNNAKAKSHVIEKTNIANHLITILSKSVEADEQAATIFALGSLMRNNQAVIKGLNEQTPSETFKKGISVISDIISNQKSTLKVSLKALTLIADVLIDIPAEDHENVSKYVAKLKVCEQLETFFALNRNSFISDIDASSTAISSFDSLKTICGGRGLSWSDSSSFRHELLIALNNFKAQLNESEEDSKFLYEEVVEKIENLTKFLYDHIKISDDDLTAKYKVNDEL